MPPVPVAAPTPPPTDDHTKAQADALAANAAAEAAHKLAEKEEAEAKAWSLTAAESERLAKLADSKATAVCHTEQVKHNITMEEKAQAVAARESATTHAEALANANKELAGAKACKADCPNLQDAEKLVAEKAAASKAANAEASKQEAEAEAALAAERAATAECSSAHIAASEAHGKADKDESTHKVEVAEAEK